MQQFVSMTGKRQVFPLENPAYRQQSLAEGSPVEPDFSTGAPPMRRVFLQAFRATSAFTLGLCLNLLAAPAAHALE
jgi:hypothetical protein